MRRRSAEADDAQQAEEGQQLAQALPQRAVCFVWHDPHGTSVGLPAGTV